MRMRVTAAVGIAVSLLVVAAPARAATIEIPFTSHDGYPMFGKLVLPDSLFHGALDSNAPIEAVKELEARSRAAAKANLTFQYFAGGDHSLGLGDALTRNVTPPALTAMIDYIVAQAAPGR